MALMLHVHLLGDFRLIYGDTLVTTVNTARLQSLLAYLVLHREAPQLRQHLAFLFWPDSTEAQARTNLRHQVHLFRQAVPEADHFLSADAQTLQWRPDASFTLDVADFENELVPATSTPVLRKAVERYQGDLLPSCYDEWILPERERLRQTFIGALERLIELLENERDYSTAISYAQRLLRTDPLHEATYRNLMRLHTLSGDRAGGLRAYHTCVTVLQRELAVEPGPATREVYERLLNVPAASVLPVVSSTALSALPPVVGRQQEWGQLQAAWRAAGAGRPQLVLLTGEAGIGKTRLAEELLQWASRQGLATASARCYAAEGELAYAPVTTWLRARPLPALEPLWLSEVARLLPEILLNQAHLSPPGPLTEAWQRQRLFEALARAILEDRQPLLLLLDDLQWCDRDTLEWLHYLLRFDLQARLFIIGTVRSEEIDSNHPLASLRSALRQGRQLTELELKPLEVNETASLAASVASRDLEPELTMRLHQETEGNPLFVVETVRAGLSRGAEVKRLASPLPPRVQTVIETRLAQLSPAARELASVAATIGRAFTFAVLAQASGADEDTVVLGLDELWQRRIVREQGREAYDFSHDKLREVAYEGLSLARRRLFHRRVAQALETIHAADLDTVSGQMASHYEQAGLLEQAIPYYQRAVEAAQRLYANEEAIGYLRRALALLETAPLSESQSEWRLAVTAQLYERLGDILLLISQRDEAEDAFQNALAHIPPHHTIWQARLHRKIARIRQEQRRFDDALQVLSIADTLLGQEPPGSSAEWWQEWIHNRLEHRDIYYWLNQVQKMTELMEKLRPAVEQYGTPAQRTLFFQGLTTTALRRDRYVTSEETLTDARAALAAAQETRDLRQITAANFHLGFSHLWHGDLDEAQEQLQTGLELAERTGYIWMQTACLTYLTIVYRKRQQVKETRYYASQSLAVATKAQILPYIGMAKANLAWVAQREGNLAEAQELGQAAWELLQQVPQGQMFPWVVLWPLLGVKLAQGQMAEAIEYGRALLAATGQPLPTTLTAALAAATQAWEEAQSDQSRSYLVQAAQLAQQMGYL